MGTNLAKNKFRATKTLVDSSRLNWVDSCPLLVKNLGFTSQESGRIQSVALVSMTADRLIQPQKEVPQSRSPAWTRVDRRGLTGVRGADGLAVSD